MNNDDIETLDPEPNRCPDCGGLRSIYADDCVCKPARPPAREVREWAAGQIWETREGFRMRVDSVRYDGIAIVSMVAPYRTRGFTQGPIPEHWTLTLPAPAPERIATLARETGKYQHALATGLRLLANPGGFRPEDIHAGMTCGGTVPAPTNAELLRLADALEGVQ